MKKAFSVEVPVAGSRFRPDSKKVKAGDMLRLEADPENPYDPQAIKVLHAGRHVGFVPKTATEQFHKWASPESPLGSLIVTALYREGVLHFQASSKP